MKDEDGIIVGKEELVVDRWKIEVLHSGTREEVENSKYRVGVNMTEETEEVACMSWRK